MHERQNPEVGSLNPGTCEKKKTYPIKVGNPYFSMKPWLSMI